VPDLLIDTDVFVDHVRGAAELRPGRHRLHYSVITRAELMAGNSASDQIRLLLAPFRELGVTSDVADRAGRIRRETALLLPDALIAATALEAGMALVTRNEKHFNAVRQLRLRRLR
jgi:predicted nucleic acid-binding protein